MLSISNITLKVGIDINILNVQFKPSNIWKYNIVLRNFFKEELKMTKIKKIIASAMATMALATCIAGISTMQNNATYSRYCTALVTIRRNLDNGFVTSNGNEGARGQDGSVSATVYGYTGSDYKVTYSGNIRSGNVVQSPSDWTPSY